MKKISLLLIVMLAVLLLPFNTMAKSKKVNIYFFRGDGCPHCEEAENFFASIKEKYGKYFNLVDYEVWSNKSNAELMEKVAEERGEEADGVPYIVIGDHTWSGYQSDYDEAIIAEIKTLYDQNPNDRYDVMDEVNGNDKTNYFRDSMIALAFIVVIAGIIAGVYFTRKKAN